MYYSKLNEYDYRNTLKKVPAIFEWLKYYSMYQERYVTNIVTVITA